MHASGVESLCEEVPVYAPHDRCFLEGFVAPQPPGEGLFNQEVFIEVSEDLRDGCPRHLSRDTKALNLAQGAHAPMTLDVRFGARAGQRGAAVVQGAFSLQASDRGLNIVLCELTPREARAHLCLA